MELHTNTTFTDYIRFEHTASKTKSRLDAVLSNLTHTYFEERRKQKEQRETTMRNAFPKGALIANYSKADRIESKEERKADFCLSMGTQHLSSIYPFGENGFAFGDIPHTDDMLIFRDTLEISSDGIRGGALEIWIAPHKLKERNLLLQMVDDGFFDEELERLRDNAKEEPKANPYSNSVFSYQNSNPQCMTQSI